MNRETASTVQATRSRVIAIAFAVFSLSLSVMAWSAAFNLYAVPDTFTDDHDHTVHLSDWRGRSMILTMEHSSCRFSCAVSISKLIAIQALADKEKNPIDIVIISIDPRNDTPETWRQFRADRGESRNSWHLLTGDEAATKEIADLLGIKYWYMDDHVLHDFKIVRVNGKGEIDRTITDYDDDAETLLH